MPFSFSTTEPNQLGQVSKFDVPLNEWMGLKFSEGRSFTFGNAISEGTEEMIWDDDNPVKPEVLNRVYGIDSRLKFDSPMSIQRARLIHERKRRELERLAYLESGSHSWFSAKAAAGFGASLVGGLAHPLDFGLAFLPFIGSERAATQVAKMGGGTFRQSLARGIITTEEALAAKGVPFTPLVARVIDGTLSQAVVELPVAIQKYRNQSEYTLTDSVFNIVAGGAFAGAIKGLGLALERAGRLWTQADPRVREAVLMDTVNTIITGEQPKAHWAMGLDEATIRAKTEERIRGNERIVSPAVLLKDGSIKTGQIHAMIEGATDTGAVHGFVTDLGRFVTREEADLLPKEKPTMRVLGDVSADEIQDPFRRAAYLEEEIKNASPEEVEALQRQLESTKQEIAAMGFELRGDVYVPTRELTVAEQATRRQSISDFNAKAKADYEQRIAGQVDAETKRVMDEVRKQVPVLAADLAKKHSIPRVVEDSHIAAVTEEIADIEASIMATARTPEDMARLQQRLKKVQAEAEELSGEKAIDKMLPCVAKRAE